MGIFGWSLPAGCGSLPGEDDPPCQVCGQDDSYCICPECAECGSVGDPDCYDFHGLDRTAEQITSLAKKEAKWETRNREESEY